MKGNLKWRVLPHAAEQVQKRFGIKAEHVNNFVNQMMENSVEVHSAEPGRSAYAHKTKDFFAAVYPNEHVVITVIDKKAEQVAVRSQFLDSVLTKMERELHKMERDYNRKVRGMQRQIAEMTIERGWTLIKHSNVYHPTTQEILLKQAEAIKEAILRKESEIAATTSEYRAASVKLSRFIWSSGEREV